MLHKIKLEFYVDDDCDECKRDFDDILKYYPGIKLYGDLIDIPDGKVLVLSPDYSDTDKLTHYHMDIIDKSKIEHTWVV